VNVKLHSGNAVLTNPSFIEIGECYSPPVHLLEGMTDTLSLALYGDLWQIVECHGVTNCAGIYRKGKACLAATGPRSSHSRLMDFLTDNGNAVQSCLMVVYNVYAD
jgi:hypothetical protein